MSNEIVIFDFCETLVDFQTADAFVDFARANLNRPSMCRREKMYLLLKTTGFIKFMTLLTRRKYSIGKRIKLWQLKGVEADVLETIAKRFYINVIRPHLINETIEELKKYDSRGCDIWLISGAYQVYLKYFVKEFNVKQLLSSDIQIKNNKCTGRMEGIDCMRKHKVELLYKTLGSRINSVRIVASYSDSISDLPILKVGKISYVVGARHKEWAVKNGFEEIIWKKPNC